MFQKALLNVPISSHPKEKQSVTDTLPMVMDVKELEKALCISRKTAYDLVKKPDFPSFRVGGRILINRAGLQRWIDQQSEQFVA